MTNTNDWVLATEESGYTRHFGGEALPVSIGGHSEDDIHLAGIAGSLQVGALDDVFFIQPGKYTENLRIAGELLRGTRKIQDGDVIALDSARLTCRLVSGRLTLSIEAQVTAGDTAPPDLEELAKQNLGEAGEVEITPVLFSAADGVLDGKRSFRPSKAATFIAAAFFVLAVLGWFAFTAKSVELAFEPPVDEVTLPGTVFKFNLDERYLIRSGTHRVLARLEGYYPLDTTFEVGQSPAQSIPLKLTKLPGLISLATDPEIQANVMLDGEYLGDTPMVDEEIVPGLHQLTFSAERFLSEVRELNVEGGHEPQRLSVALTPNWAPIEVSTEPPGAEILIDGVSMGTTPQQVEVTAGERQLEVRLSGHNAQSQRVLVVADTPQQLPTFSLQLADGRLQLDSEPSEADVTVNGEFRGRTPLPLRLTPRRSHEIRLTKPGYAIAIRELSLAADSGQTLVIELEALFGVVDVASDPPNAEIWIDDRRAGVTPSTLNVMAVNHKIEVRLAGFAPQAQEITTRPGYSQTLSFRLEALDDSSGSGYPRIVTTYLDQELRLVPAGQFTMGASRREQGRLSNQVLRDVKLSRAFYLGVHEVTNAEFRELFDEHDSGDYAGFPLNGDDQPVVRVTWEEIAQYLNWLSIQDGLQPVYRQTASTWEPARPLRNGYRLPSEAEWAWAARAAGRETTLIYPWGQELPPPDRSGNYADLTAEQILPTTLVIYNDGFEVSAPVGSFEPNLIGIYDLGGNVVEWIQDFYEIDIRPSEDIVIDPLGPESGRFHMVRGASWRSATVTDLRLAYRSYSTDSREDLGFRIARNLE